MARETEIKILDIDKEEIHKKLIEKGARYLKKVRQVNQIFDHNNRDILIRIRTEEGKAIFTTKKSISRGEFKISHELETFVSSPEIFAQQLEIMGYSLSWYLEKDRASYQYKETLVTIDEYPDIPPFVEIEGHENTIRVVVRELGYEMKDTTSMNFRDLIERYQPGKRELKFGK
jgi:adenylate cyclase class 2